MTNRYRNQNGLLLPDAGLALPKPEIPAPWWAGRLSPARGMSRRRCCCGAVTDPCGSCTGNPPAYISVRIADITNNPCSCTGFNGDWELPQCLTSGCLFAIYTGISTTCSESGSGGTLYGILGIILHLTDVTLYVLWSASNDGCGALRGDETSIAIAVFQCTMESGYNCMDIPVGSLTRIGSYSTGCDASSATASILEIG